MSDSDLDDWLDYTITHSRCRPTGAACHHLDVAARYLERHGGLTCRRRARLYEERRLAVARGLDPSRS